MDFSYLASVVVSIMFVLIAVFQVLLSLGLPLGEFALGGNYIVLPTRLRIVSAINAIIVIFMAVAVLQHSSIIKSFDFLPTTIILWIITIFLGLNTIANIISQSKKERIIMTPLSSVAFLLCLFIVLS